ncbi:MAG: tyrosine-type recombinase/integrase [Rhodoferax sp.]
MPIVKLSAQVATTALCPPHRKKVDLYDNATSGFVLELRASGGKTYYLRYRDPHGKQRQHKIGDAASLSFDKARAAAQKIRSRVLFGENPTEEKKALRQIPTLAAFVADVYMDHMKVTRRNYAPSVSFLKVHLLPRFGQMHLDQITSQSIAEACQDMRSRGYAQSHCNNIPSTLKVIYNVAKKRKVPGSEVNPAVDVKIANPNNARQRFLSLEEIQRLRIAIDRSSNPQLKHIVNLAILLLCRKRELLDSRWSDFDLERRNWRIPMSKSGKARNVPLSSAVLEILAKLPRWENCPWVVPHPFRLKPFISVYWSWDKARREAGLRDVTMHDLRHTGASHLLAAGADVLTVSKVLGHSNLRMAERYIHLGNATLLRSVDALGTLVGSPESATQQAPV